jgi:type II secretory ATPase GspE/PulE/Tfp pilus assembly ATPase PilB-like protein
MQAIRNKSSDIHVEPLKKELRIRFRIDGVLHNIMSPPKKIQPLLTSRLKIMANIDISERRIPQDGRIQLIVDKKEFDFRVSTYPTIFGEKVVMRILDKSGAMIGLDKLGFQSATQALFEDLIDNPYGILLVTGPTGSGKTTTLYSALYKLNTIEKNIITIEDPIEYQMDGINQIQVQEKAGLRFDNTLRAIVRQDPDIVMVGEIRDPQTAEIAINASLTGHLVLSTLHTNDSSGATTRLIDMGIEPYLVSSSLIGVLAQRLVRVICSNCKESYSTHSSTLKKFGISIPDKEITLYKGKGCDVCRGTGYQGRVGVFELLYVDDKIREMVVEKRSAVEIKEQSRRQGMKTLQEDCLDKVLSGITTVAEAIRVVYVEE